MKLKGKAALVTGAAKRVGREIALGLARKGIIYHQCVAVLRRISGQPHSTS